MSSSKITIKEVARKAGVSTATVSRFLNKTSLKEKNQKQIEEVIKELGYQPSLYARRLAGGKLGTFGLIIPGYEDIFYSYYAIEIMREVAADLSSQDIDLHLNVFWDKDDFKTSLIDAVLMADIIRNEDQLKRLIKEEIPLVVINNRAKEYDVSSVAIDNFKGASKAIEFLVHHGHKRIAHLAGDLRVQCSQERLEGYKSVLEKKGIKVSQDYVKVIDFSRKRARAALEELFSLEKAPTAVFCCSDEVAIEVLNFAKEKGINIPKDLSVIGFDDNPQCLYDKLMLTTVRQPLKEMVHQAIKILKEITERTKSPQKIVLDTELIIRDTVSFI
ncbi:MAG: LacI family DNA-binding transcriptional regulator [Candidatus Omnitrophota bacterium]